jgi:hypothetical protein
MNYNTEEPFLQERKKYVASQGKYSENSSPLKHENSKQKKLILY